MIAWQMFWAAISVAGMCVAIFYARRARRIAAEANLRVTQLGAGEPSGAQHPYDCPYCGERFKRRSWKPTEGERGYCGRCLVWHQIFPPIDAPGPREGS